MLENQAPAFRASSSDRFAIKRFLDFAISDIEHQTNQTMGEMPSKLGILSSAALKQHDKRVASLKMQAGLLIAYVKSLRDGIDEMDEVRPTEN